MDGHYLMKCGSTKLILLLKNNFRVIAYDRRGFGKSSQPWDMIMTLLADDLKGYY
jgi:pimeloyl-ACP methyl ester carboxylesterase